MARLFLIIFISAFIFGGSSFADEPTFLKKKIDACFVPMKALGQFLTPQAGILHFPYEDSYSIKSPPQKSLVGRVAAKSLRGLQELGGALEYFFSPLPIRFVKAPTSLIFRKLWKDPQYTPSVEERVILKKYKSEKVFDEKKAFMAKWPRWVKFQRAVVWARRVALGASLALALNHGFQLGAHPISQSEYLNSPNYVLASNQVQLINEVVPFPHTSIRIGDKVYSYGYTHLSVKTPSEYFASRKDWEGAFVEEAKEASSSAHPTQALTAALGKLPRSVQVITLNLKQSERDSLKRDLEMATGDRYYNVTLVNDCTTMVLRALERNTSIHLNRLIDASPSQVAFYFSSLKSGGSTLVGPTYQVAIDESATHFVRNLYMNSLESKIFIDLFAYDQAHRLYIDIFKSKSDLQYREPAMEAVIDRLQQDVKDEVHGDPQIRTFLATAREFKRSEMSPDEIQEFREIVRTYFDQKLQAAEAKYQDPETDFKDIIANQSRMEALSQERDRILQQLE